jgi:hypothetical protein
LQKMIEMHAALCLQCAEEFVTFSVLAAKADRENFTDAERDEIIEDCSGRARLAADVYHVENIEAGLDRNFRFCRIDFEITIEAKVADHGDTQLRVLRGDFVEAREIHMGLWFCVLRGLCET